MSAPYIDREKQLRSVFGEYYWYASGFSNLDSKEAETQAIPYKILVLDQTFGSNISFLHGSTQISLHYYY